MRIILLILCVLPFGFLCGCYAGAAGIALGIVAATKGGGAAVNEAPAAPVIEAPVRLDGAHVHVRYFLLDDDGGPLRVAVEWQPEGEARFFPATEEDTPAQGVASEGTEAILTEPNRSRETHFLWRARSDLERILGAQVARVRIRIRAFEGEVPSDAGLSPPFVAGNERPFVERVGVDPDFQRDPLTGAVSGVVPIQVTVSDSTCDLVKLIAEYSLGGEAPRSMSLIGAGSSTAFPSCEANGGATSTLVWNTVRDIPRESRNDVTVLIRARDDFEPEREVAGVLPLAVDNNVDPVVRLVDVASSPDRSFEVPIRFSIEDAESHPVSVALQWAIEGEPFPPLPGDLTLLREALGGSGGAELEELRRTLHLLTESSRPLRGVLDTAPELSLREVRLTDLSRRGVLFLPPEGDGPRPLPSGPFGPASEVFIIGLEIRLVHAPSGLDVSRRIVGFDPATSTATLSEPPLESLPPPRTEFEIRLDRGLRDLSSAPRGVLHTFIWDCLSDLNQGERALDGPTHVRAVGIDSQMGTASESLFNLESGFLVPSQKLLTALGSSLLSSTAIGDLNDDGRDDLVAGDSNSSRVPVYLQSPIGELPSTPSFVLNIPQFARALAAGDLDGDGRCDLVVASWLSQSALSVFRQRTAGGTPCFSFPCEPDLNVSSGVSRPSSVAIGDIDGDQVNDIVVASTALTRVQVYRGVRDSLPEASPRFSLVTETSPAAVALGDVDGAGGQDVLVANAGSGSVGVYLSRPGGPGLGVDPQALQPSYRLEAGSRPVSLTVADLNGDSRQDLAVADEGAGGEVGSMRLFLQDPLGRLAPAGAIVSGGRPSSLGTGDLNGDGFRDLVLLNAAEDQALVFLFLKESGGFGTSPSQTLTTDSGPRSVALGDLNGDGGLDVAAACESSGTVRTYLQNLPGRVFPAPEQTLSTDEKPGPVSLADLDGDGRSDIAIASTGAASIDLYLQGSSGEFSRQASLILETGDEPTAMAIGDLDGDGFNDLAAVNRKSGTIGLYLHDGDGGVGRPPASPGLPRGASSSLTAESDPFAICAADVTGDGKIDLVLASKGSTRVKVFEPGRAGHGQADPFLLECGVIPAALAVGDADGDGRADVLAANPAGGASGQLRIFRSGPSGRPEGTPQVLRIEQDPGFMSLGDLRGDNLNELVVTTRASQQSIIYCPLARDGFESCQSFLGLSTSTTLTLADVTGDGAIDLLVTLLIPVNGYTTALSMNRGGSFDSAPEPLHRQPPGVGPQALCVSDLNGDGRNDLVITNGGNRTATIYLAR